MKAAGCMIVVGALLAVTRGGASDGIDRLDDALTWSADGDRVRARLSGSLDLESYHYPDPAPGLLFAQGSNLFNPRLSLFLDAQLGPRVYGFVQARVDRGFDPSDDTLRGRLDEYALRYTPGIDGRFNVQLGKFATVVGNWTRRHRAWDNPFITAPLPYENLTGIWDVMAVFSSPVLLEWAHVVPGFDDGNEYADKARRLPIIWGPSYTTGLAVFGGGRKFDYAAEVKNAALSSRPDVWGRTDSLWRHPAFSGRLGYRPDERWNLGLSASTGSYLQPSAEPTLAPGHGLGDYREIVLAQDLSYAWHHWQVWAETYVARFAIPRVGHVDTLAYYVETKVKLTPQFFVAVRWNQQAFSAVRDRTGTLLPWGRNVWRLDVAPGYRFTPHLQLKLQYSLQRETASPHEFVHLLATQLTLRF